MSLWLPAQVPFRVFVPIAVQEYEDVHAALLIARIYRLAGTRTW